MKYTIITPVYNSFHLMTKYFESLKNQTFKNFEVIMIDDCSKENDYIELSKYIEKLNLNIKLIRNDKNLGPGMSRNRGLKESTGEYLLFLDSDDYLDENSLNIFNGTLEEHKIDALIFDYYQINKGKKHYGDSIPNTVKGSIHYKKAVASTRGMVACKVYKRKLIEEEKIVFPDLLRFEDMVFNRKVLSKATDIVYVKEALYYYVNNEQSIVNAEENRKIDFSIKAYEILESYLGKEFENELETIFVREVLYSTTLTLIQNKESKNEIIKHINKMEKKHPNWYENQEIKNFTSHQRIILKLIQHKNILGLRLLIKLMDTLKNR